jgi:hypothetical protein
MLVIGLGNTGRLVAQSFKACSTVSHRGTCEIRVFDLDDPWGSAERLGLDPGEVHTLPSRQARQLLRNATAWSPYLDWLPQGKDLYEFDELAPTGGGGQRWLGRLSFFAGDTGIQDTIRASLARIRQKSGEELGRAVFAASLGGGTGSGLLADVTYLVRHLARNASCTAYLLLPGIGSDEPLRSGANTYAALKELYFLKYQTLPFEAYYPNICERVVPTGLCEPWQRIYLFSPGEGEAPPYRDTIDRMALAISAQTQADLVVRSVSISQREVLLAERGEIPSPTTDFCFSTCELSRELNWTGGARVETPQGSAGGAEGSNNSEQETMIGDADLMRRFTIHLGGALRNAVNIVAAEIEARLDHISERCHDLNRSDREKSLRELGDIERAILKVLNGGKASREKDAHLLRRPSGWRRFWIFLTRNPKSLAHSGVDFNQEGDLGSLPGWHDALEIVQEGLERYLVAIPVVAQGDSGQRIANRFREDNNFYSSTSYHRALEEQDKLIMEFGQDVESRCAIVKAIVKNAGFRQRLRHYLLEVKFPVQGEVPPRETEMGEAVNSGRREAEHNPVAEAIWRERIEATLRSSVGRVFVKAERPGPSRSFAIALIPEVFKEQATESLIIEYTKDQCRKILSCQCEVLITPEDRISVYYEDLFHSHCEIQNLQTWKGRYLREPKRERLHTHFQFVPTGRFEELCERGPIYLTALCGNTGCSENIGKLPPDSRMCPACREPIRSRCGNEGCNAQDLHTREWKSRSCPECGGFNHAAWWLCCRHGKVPVWVPIDKKLCPMCVVRHQEAPLQFPEETVGRRPYGGGGRECPNCRRLTEDNSQQRIFILPEDLVSFFKNGVNGHNRRTLAGLAEKYGLPQGYKCPICRTALIPVCDTARQDDLCQVVE